MRVRKNIWGGVFTATIVFTAALLLDILANQALNTSFIYASLGLNRIPAEVLFIAVLIVPVISAVSGIMFLIYFVKSRKQRKSVKMTAVTS